MKTINDSWKSKQKEVSIIDGSEYCYIMGVFTRGTKWMFKE